MKNFICTCAVITLFMSCSSSTPDQQSGNTFTDSLRTAVEKLTASDYEKRVSILKKLPEYQDAVFFSEMETKDYMDVIRRIKDKYKTKNYIHERDNSQLLGSVLNDIAQLKIVFDTVQSAVPIAELYYSTSYTSTDGDYTYTDRVFNFYYIPKFNIGFVRGKQSGSFSYTFSSRDDLELFDKVVRGFN